MTQEEYNEFYAAYAIRIGPSWLLNTLIETIRENEKEFEILGIEYQENYFPDYIKLRFEKYYNFFEEVLQPIIESLPLKMNGKSLDEQVKNDILRLSSGLEKTIDTYYEGKIYEATLTFNDTINTVIKSRYGMRESSLITESLSPGHVFYRARPGTDYEFSESDLFHIPFEKRHFASTNRYNPLGTLGLYLSTDPYTCFRELNNPDLKTLNYSRFENNSELKIMRIQRVEEAIHDLLKENALLRQYADPTVLAWDTEGITNYLATFPLVIACTIKVKNDKGSFKPEYIIPQLLLQNLASDNLIDGLKYPTSKIILSGDHAVQAFHNYIFPVKSIHKSGFCTRLTKIFNLTKPTSLELEGITDSYIETNGLNSLYHIAKSLESKKVFSLIK